MILSYTYIYLYIRIGILININNSNNKYKLFYILLISIYNNLYFFLNSYTCYFISVLLV